jgi:hypothetical protein
LESLLRLASLECFGFPETLTDLSFFFAIAETEKGREEFETRVCYNWNNSAAKVNILWVRYFGFFFNNTLVFLFWLVIYIYTNK